MMTDKIRKFSHCVIRHMTMTISKCWYETN